MRLLDKELYDYSHTDMYPFHMPGHKRQMIPGYLENPYGIDITEITGFDNLHHAEGILKENQDYAAKIYGAERTCFLINGSTAGILAAVSACTSPGGTILMARNSHKAVYHGAYLRNLKTRYLYPPYKSDSRISGGISAEEVRRAMEGDPDIEAVLVTSPSYDGIVSDIAQIAYVVHAYGAVLIVDEAHGAHFPFSDYFPESSMHLGADLVIQSLHKTLPSLTQTAVLHIQSGRVSTEKLERFLEIYQTSSPSYVLMAGMAACFRYLESKGKEEFQMFSKRLQDCRNELKRMNALHLEGEELIGKGNIFAIDKSKLVISTAHTPINGPQLHKCLRERYHLELEMEAEEYVIALTSVKDTKEGFARLVKALIEIDEELCQDTERRENTEESFFLETKEVSEAEQYLSIGRALESETEEMSIEESEGKISAEYAYLYPPGIPLLVPGERISRSFLEQEKRWRAQGILFQGFADHTQEKIKVVKKDCTEQKK